MFKKVVLLIILFLLICAGLAFVWFHHITSKTFVERKSTPEVQFTSVEQRLQANAPVDILLLGYGGGNHDGPYLTDSMMLVHMDPKTKKVFLISIPRDIWVKLPISAIGQYSKINAAYAIGLDDNGYPNKPSEFKGSDGGGRLAETMVAQITGVPVEYFVGMDFSGFTKTIDTLGGVDVNVETTFDDYAYPVEDLKDTSCGHPQADINAFIATVSAEPQIWAYFPCRYKHVHFDAGITHMDGETALTYVRSRHSAQDGTDFGRAKRQRNVLLAVKQKILSVGFISKMLPFMNSLGDDVRTDLTLSDLTALAGHTMNFESYKIQTLALTDQNYLIDTVSSDGQDILSPKVGTDNWSDVHAWLAAVFAGKPEPVSALVQVENGTSTSGLALSVANKIDNSGLTILPVKNASTKNAMHTSVTVYGNNLNPSDMSVLQKLFNPSIISIKQATSSAYNVLVVVGDDYIKASPTPSLSQKP